jgi:hypothetical protein
MSTGKQLRAIKQLIKLLERQGLIKGRLHVHNKAFVYDQIQGLREEPLEKSLTQREASPEAVDMDVKVRKPKPTIKRGEAVPDKRYQGKKRTQTELEMPARPKKESTLLPKLLVLLVLIVVVLTVAIITLNKNLSQSEPDPMAVSEIEAGERIDTDQNPDMPVNDDSIDPVDENTEEQSKNIKAQETGITKPTSNSEKTVEVKPETPKPQPYRSTITIREIPDSLSHQYSQKMKILRLDLPRKTNVSGYLSLNMFINESGKVFLASLNDAAFRIEPDSKKKKVLKNLREVIEGIKLPVPVDQKGRTVKVSNWRLNYLVTQFKRRMILRKQ